MKDIIAFGSATRDIFVRSSKFFTVAGKDFMTGEGICLTAGAKIEVDDMIFASGGGGTNTAATFARQGFKTAYCGMVGEDCFGILAIEELRKLGISSDFVKKTGEKPTNVSIFLTYPGQDRAVLVYRGASDLLGKKDIPWNKLKANWFYLAPFSGKAANLTKDLVTFAKKSKIKVAFNPGYSQLNFSTSILKNILNKVNILFLNREEASFLTKIPYQREKDIFMELDRLVKGICVMTKGPDGVIVSDGKYLYTAPSLIKSKVADRTGAGDSFASGFLSGLIKSKGNIIYAIQLGIANSAACLTKWGAKEGLLSKNQPFSKVQVKKEPCLQGLCRIKA